MVEEIRRKRLISEQKGENKEDARKNAKEDQFLKSKGGAGRNQTGNRRSEGDSCFYRRQGEESRGCEEMVQSV
jgi:hypothetical protein